MTEKVHASGVDLEKDHFTPALQAAVKTAMAAKHDPKDILNGIVNAYSTMLVVMLDGNRDAAAKLLQAQTDHLKSAS